VTIAAVTPRVFIHPSPDKAPGPRSVARSFGF
jgi:hypothetical protein